jgi:endoglucanase
MPAKDNILKNLISFFGVSGKESAVRDYIHRQIRPYVDESWVDRMGNLIARKKGKPPKVMLAAHMDEIGLMVKRIEANGQIYCTAIGGVDPSAFIGSQVHIQTKKGTRLHGFITTKEMSAGKYITKLPEIEDIFVDTGLDKKELKKLGVEIGNYIYLEESPCCEGKGGIILGKSLDNRIGCYILIELARKLKKSSAEIFFVFTVQEEIGLYGAKTSAFEIEPDWGIAVDTTHANDIFEEPSRWIGRGPCITIKDGEFISNPCIVGWLKEIAKRKGIPYQLEATEEGTTDASTIQISRGGIPTAVISVPVRNIHTTAGIAHMKDINNAIRLLQELMKKPPVKCVV